MECGFSDISSRHICSTVAETIGVTNYAASFGTKKCPEDHIWSCWDNAQAVEPTRLCCELPGDQSQGDPFPGFFGAFFYLLSSASFVVTTYKISVYTEDVPDADTRANVNIKLFGEFGNSEQLGLRQSETKRKKFLPGQVDVFTFRDQPWLGKLSRIRVWHDNEGPNPAWYLSSIYILDELSGRLYGILIDSWLSKEHGAVLKETSIGAMTLFKELCKFVYNSTYFRFFYRAKQS